MAEQTYMIFHPTRLAYVRWYVISFLLFFVGITIFSDLLPISFLISEYKLYLTLAVVVLGIILIIVAELMRKDNTYAITSHRIVEKSGIINIKEDSIYWEKFSNYSFHQGLIDRMFGLGTIQLWSIGGEDKAQVVIKRAPHFKKIITILDKLIEKR